MCCQFDVFTDGMAKRIIGASMTTAGSNARDWIYREGDVLPEIAVTRLHAILAGRTTWTDELWEQAATYLSGRLSMVGAQTLAAFIADADALRPHDSDALRAALFKKQQMEIYRKYPPTVLLAFFDLARAHGFVR